MTDVPQSAPSGDSEIPPGGSLPQKHWALPFALFVTGFAILIAASKIAVAALPGYLLKGSGAALCVAGFLLVRGARPPKR